MPKSAWPGRSWGVVAIVVVALVLNTKVGAKDAGPMRFDWVGAGIPAVALISFLMAITNGHAIGWGSPIIFAGFVTSVCLLAAFLWWEDRTEDPMLDLNFFSSRVFSLGVSARFLSFPFIWCKAWEWSPARRGC